MEKKHLIMIVALLFALVLVFGLVLELTDRQPAQNPAQPTGGSTQSTGQTAETTVPTEPSTMPPETTVPTTEPTRPEETTASTEPDCVHQYKTAVTEPTAQAAGYTTYTCSLCGYSYRDDFTAALTVQQVVNRVELSPASTGVDELDIRVEMLLGAVADEDLPLYDRLLEIYTYQRSTMDTESVQVDPREALAFAGDKIFASANEMIIAYEAYQIIESNRGLPDHYAALFMVLTRSIGLESYVVSGQYRGQSHVWNAVMLEGETYYVDTCRDGGAFLVHSSEAGDYVCTDAPQAIAAQPGFAGAKALEVKLELKTAGGTDTKTFTWSAGASGDDASTFMCCQQNVKCSGKVEYTLTVSGGSDVYLTDENGAGHSTATISGTLAAGTDAELTAEDLGSLMSIRIRIDN